MYRICYFFVLLMAIFHSYGLILHKGMSSTESNYIADSFKPSVGQLILEGKTTTIPVALLIHNKVLFYSPTKEGLEKKALIRFFIEGEGLDDNDSEEIIALKSANIAGEAGEGFLVVGELKVPVTNGIPLHLNAMTDEFRCLRKPEDVQYLDENGDQIEMTQTVLQKKDAWLIDFGPNINGDLKSDDNLNLKAAKSQVFSSMQNTLVTFFDEKLKKSGRVGIDSIGTLLLMSRDKKFDLVGISCKKPDKNSISKEEFYGYKHDFLRLSTIVEPLGEAGAKYYINPKDCYESTWLSENKGVCTCKTGKEGNAIVTENANLSLLVSASGVVERYAEDYVLLEVFYPNGLYRYVEEESWRYLPQYHTFTAEKPIKHEQAFSAATIHGDGTLDFKYEDEETVQHVSINGDLRTTYKNGIQTIEGNRTDQIVFPNGMVFDRINCCWNHAKKNNKIKKKTTCDFDGNQVELHPSGKTIFTTADKKKKYEAKKGGNFSIKYAGGVVEVYVRNKKHRLEFPNGFVYNLNKSSWYYDKNCHLNRENYENFYSTYFRYSIFPCKIVMKQHNGKAMCIIIKSENSDELMVSSFNNSKRKKQNIPTVESNKKKKRFNKKNKK